MKVIYTETDFWDTRQDFQKRYEAKVTRAYDAVKKLLPELPGNVTFVVQMDSLDAIPETGEGGYTKNSRLIILSIDSGLPYGEDGLLVNVRYTIFHELIHAARSENKLYRNSFVESCVDEGVATVFERDYAKSEPLWGKYNTEEAQAWLEEIMNQADEVDNYQYMFRHKDGRRWIGYKVGTYLIDEAINNSGKSVVELARMECSKILELANIS